MILPKLIKFYLRCRVWKIEVLRRRRPVCRDSLSGCRTTATSDEDDFPRLQTPAKMIVSSFNQRDRQISERGHPIKLLTGSVWLWNTVPATDDVVAHRCVLPCLLQISNWTGTSSVWIENLGRFKDWFVSADN